MRSRAQDVLRDALALPLDERADVAARLLASLDDAATERPADVEAAWAAEIERRAVEPWQTTLVASHGTTSAAAPKLNSPAVNPRVRFDDEADAEYRFAGRW